MISRYSSPPLASRHKKGKRRSSMKGDHSSSSSSSSSSYSLPDASSSPMGEASIAARSVVERERERGEGVIIKQRHWKRKLVDAYLLILVPLVAQEHVLALTSVTTVGGHKMHIFTVNKPSFHSRYGRYVLITNEFHEFC
jgi:hypothetical protein